MYNIWTSDRAQSNTTAVAYKQTKVYENNACMYVPAQIQMHEAQALILFEIDLMFE